MNHRIEEPVHRSRAMVSLLVAVTLLVAGCATHSNPVSATKPTHEFPADERPVIGLQHEGPIRVVYQIDADEWKDGVGKGLLYLRNLHAGYIHAGVEADRIHIHAVFHGTAAEHLLTDDAWKRWHKDLGGNPNTELIAELTRLGVAVELCDTRRVANGWAKDDIHPDVVLVGAAYQRIIDLQLRGFTYIRF